MSIEYHWESNGVIRKYRGTLASADIFSAQRTTESDFRFSDLRWMISDLLDVDRVEVTEHVIDRVVAGVIGASYTNNRIKVAIVATHPALIALAQEFAAAVPNYPIRIFSSLQEAKSWACGTNRPTPQESTVNG